MLNPLSNQNDEDFWFSLPPTPPLQNKWLELSLSSPPHQNEQFPSPPSPSLPSTHPPVSPTRSLPSPTSSVQLGLNSFNSPAELPVGHDSYKYKLPRTDLNFQGIECQPEPSSPNSPLSTTEDQMNVDPVSESPSKESKIAEADKSGMSWRIMPAWPT